MSEEERDSFDRLAPELRSQVRDLIPLPFAASVLYVPLGLVSLVLACTATDTIPGDVVRPMDLLLHALLGVAVGLAMMGTTRLLAHTVRAVADLEREFRNVLRDLPGKHVAWLAVLAGFSEEIFFRGVLQAWLQGAGWCGDPWGYVVTSILFGLVHFVPGSRTHLPWTILAVGGGFILGGLFLATGSLVAPIAAHCAYNLAHVWLLARRRNEPESAEGGESIPDSDGEATPA